MRIKDKFRFKMSSNRILFEMQLANETMPCAHRCCNILTPIFQLFGHQINEWAWQNSYPFKNIQ